MQLAEVLGPAGVVTGAFKFVTCLLLCGAARAAQSLRDRVRVFGAADPSVVGVQCEAVPPECVEVLAYRGSGESEFAGECAEFARFRRQELPDPGFGEAERAPPPEVRGARSVRTVISHVLQEAAVVKVIVRDAAHDIPRGRRPLV
jgi:hypothetical protein